MQRTSPMGPTDWALLLSLSLLWGGSFFFVGVAVTALPPLFIVFVRVALAALVLWATVLILGLKVPRTGKVWGAFAMMGALNNAIPFALIVWGQTGIASGVAAIQNATTPVLTVLLAAILAVEPMTRPRGGGVCWFGGRCRVWAAICRGRVRSLARRYPTRLPHSMAGGFTGRAWRR